MGATDKRPSPVGQLEKEEITERLVLPRAVLERLTDRVIREARKSRRSNGAVIGTAGA